MSIYAPYNDIQNLQKRITMTTAPYTVDTFSAFSFQRKGLIKGVPSLLEYDFSNDYTAENCPDMPPLLRGVKNMRVRALREIQNLERSIVNLSEWDYDGPEDETGWSEEDHQQWLMNVQLAAGMATMAKEKWEHLSFYDEMESRLKAKYAAE